MMTDVVTGFRATLAGDGTVHISCPYEYTTFCRTIPGAHWDYNDRVWVAPLAPVTLEMVRGVKGAIIDGAIAEALHIETLDPSDPIPDDVEGIIARMPVKLRPYDHQAAAFKRAMEVLYGQ